MGHEDDGVAGGEVERGDLARGERDDADGLGEAGGLGEMGAAIDDDDGPSEKRGHADERLCVVSGAEYDQSLGRSEVLDEDGLDCGGFGPGLELVFGLISSLISRLGSSLGRSLGRGDLA
jgi:hypothetical protein